MKKLLLLPFLLLSFIINAQTTAIPDPNFEQALIWQGFDISPINGSVPTMNIDTITQLNIENFYITDLTGIEDFSELTHLICSWNSIDSLNLSQNINLEYLDCSVNGLTQLDLTQNNNLTYLRCQGSQLNTIDLSQNINLNFLDLHLNPFNEIDVTKNVLLTYLDCSDNELDSIDISKNIFLNELRCHDNNISKLDITQNVGLITLYAENNLLNALDVSQNSLLKTLYISNNQLHNIDLSQNTALEGFTSGNNLFSVIDFSNNIELFAISISDNMLTSLDLSSNIVIEIIDCSNNNLSCLNIKNGNNHNLHYFRSFNNPNLICIEADSLGLPEIALPAIDPTTSVDTICNNDCSVIGIAELESSTVNIYPNPTSEQLTISLEETKTGNLSIRNALGQIVHQEKFENTNQLNIHLNEPNGIYYLQLETDGQIVTKKIIKQ